MPTSSVSVFIVNYNTCRLLERCLKSIFDTKGDLAIEVCVADNGSTDGSPEMVELRFPDVSLKKYSENVGYTKALNPLLPWANGQYYMFLHPDLEILPKTLERFVDFFQSNPRVGIVGGNLYYPDGTPNPCEILWPGFRNDLRCFAVRVFRRLPGGVRIVRDHNPMEWSHKFTSQVPSVWNACMMVRREVFEEVGYLDENFFVWAADWDLCKRAADAGWWTYYLHPATAIHHERQSFVEQDTIRDEIRYKVDGWYSAAMQIKDRHAFMKKHLSPVSAYGVKAIYLMENVLRLWLILCNLVFQRATSKEVSFQLMACLQTIQTILKA